MPIDQRMNSLEERQYLSILMMSSHGSFNTSCCGFGTVVDSFRLVSFWKLVAKDSREIFTSSNPLNISS